MILPSMMAASYVCGVETWLLFVFCLSLSVFIFVFTLLLDAHFWPQSPLQQTHHTASKTPCLCLCIFPCLCAHIYIYLCVCICLCLLSGCPFLTPITPNNKAIRPLPSLFVFVFVSVFVFVFVSIFVLFFVFPRLLDAHFNPDHLQQRSHQGAAKENYRTMQLAKSLSSTFFLAKFCMVVLFTILQHRLSVMTQHLHIR